MLTETKSKRIFYFDALRALAICSVIFIHCFNTSITGNVSFFSTNPSLSWVAAALFGNYTRVGVDLFLMLSGALSLGREWDIKTFLGKRIPRIVFPFLFWGFILSVAMVVFNIYYPNAFVPINQLNLISFIYYLKDCYLAVNLYVPFWFFWMILGTYLIMPVFNKWLLHSDLKEAEYFLVIWAVTCLFQYTLKIPFPVDLDYFVGPIGFVVLGYYLRYTQRKIFKNPYFIVSLLIISFVLLLCNSFEFSTTGLFYKLNRYNLFFAIEVTGIFLLFRYLSENRSIHISDNSIFRKLVSALAKYSYGMYLLHRPLIVIVYLVFGLTSVVYTTTIELFILTTAISLILMAALNKIPYLNRIIGAK